MESKALVKIFPREKLSPTRYFLHTRCLTCFPNPRFILAKRNTWVLLRLRKAKIHISNLDVSFSKSRSISSRSQHPPLRRTALADTSHRRAARPGLEDPTCDGPWCPLRVLPNLNWISVTGWQVSSRGSFYVRSRRKPFLSTPTFPFSSLSVSGFYSESLSVISRAG